MISTWTSLVHIGWKIQTINIELLDKNSRQFIGLIPRVGPGYPLSAFALP